MKLSSSTLRYQRGWPFFKASLSYVFDRKGTCGDSYCKLTKLAAACLGDKPLHVETVVRYVKKLPPALYSIFVFALSCVKRRLSRYGVNKLIRWIRRNPDRLKMYVIVYFYRSVSRPCNLELCQALHQVNIRLLKVENANEKMVKYRTHSNTQNFSWKELVPKPIRLSTSGLLREIVGHLSKIRGHNIHPLIKICTERYRPQWPLHLMLLLPRRKIFAQTIVQLRNLTSTKRLRSMFRLLTDDEKREIKTIALLHQRNLQLQVCYDDRLPKKDKVTTLVKDSTSISICQFCSTVLTYVDLKNRPPIKGVYYDNETLRFRCGNCDSRCVYKFALVDTDSIYRVGQVDLPSVGVCAGRKDCFNLVAVPSGICGTCRKK